MNVAPVTLEGAFVRLEPIRSEHGPRLWEAARDSVDEIFTWIPYPMRSAEDFERWTEKALDEQARGESIVFATVERAASRLPRYLNSSGASSSRLWRHTVHSWRPSLTFQMCSIPRLTRVS